MASEEKFLYSLEKAEGGAAPSKKWKEQWLKRRPSEREN